MNANEMTFGIEIETVAPDAAVPQPRPADRGRTSHGKQVPVPARGLDGRGRRLD